MLNRQQMELSLENTLRAQGSRPGRRRITLARWWFNRMHEVVDQTREYAPGNPSQGPQGNLLLNSGR